MILFSGCIEKTPFYTDINSPSDDTFGAGDTSYVLLSPIWDGSIGLQAPVEISIAQDGFVYIVDSTAKSIIVVDQSGLREAGYEDLLNLEVTPIDVDIDQKMNVFYIDGSEKVFRWNQYWNEIGIDSVVTSATFVHNIDGTEITLSIEADEWIDFANNYEWSISSITWEANSSIIDSLLAPHIFYDGSLPKNIYKDEYYDSDSSRFSGLTTFNRDENAIVVTDIGGTDSSDHRLMQIDFARSHIIRLSNGFVVWGHTGFFGQTLIQEGTGAGYANSPVSLDTDGDGNIYYTQSGIQYGVHKVKPVTTGSYTSYTSLFTEGVNNIMDLHRFDNPTDIAADNKSMIYVANKESREIQVFDFNGNLFKKAGVEEITIDTTFIINGQSVDSSYTYEVKDQLVAPSAVTVDDRGVIYVCDTPTGQIFRYRLSNVLDEDLQPNP